ncbi:MAG: exosortase-associated EpsI family protein [Caldilineaceae bacterium]|nr:exosortase-associated EpsI family protein [Caldilineaceae bacterium]
MTAGVFVLLIAGAAIVYSPQFLRGFGTQPTISAADELTYVTDLDFWQRTPRERTVLAASHFDLDHELTDVPLQVGAWVGEEVPETNEEVLILLEPEQYVQRLYKDDQDRYIWLSMVGGRNSQPFHAPDICYDADGWQYDLGSHPTTLDGGGEVYGLWLDARKEMPEGYTAEHVVYYFYLFPDDRRDQGDGIVLFKLTSGRYGDLEQTLAMHEEFTRQFFEAAAAPANIAQADN